MLGCPHYTLEELRNAAGLLEGKRIHENTNLWIFTPRALKSIADQEGISGIIKDAGATLMTDTCPCISRRKGIFGDVDDFPPDAIERCCAQSAYFQ